MDFLSQGNGLVKVGPEPPAESASSWAVGRGGQSNAGWRKVMQRMFPMKMHHLAMAAAILTESIILLVEAFCLNYDLFLKLSSDMEVIDRYTQPSDRYSGFPQAIAEIFAIFLIIVAIICFYRWFCHPEIPPGIQNSVVYVDPEAPAMSKSIFMNLMSMEIENFIIYFFLMMFFALVAATNLHLPETLLWPNYSVEFRYLENPIFCFIGFGIFGWLKPFIIAFSGGFAVLCAVSVINFYQHYLRLEYYEKVSVVGITEHADGQNSTVLLNAQFSSWPDIQNLGDRGPPEPKAMEIVYIPPVKVLKNCGTPAGDMRVA